jgi:hypothetical protein
LGAFVEVVCAEVLVEGAIFEHVVSGSEDGSSDSTDGLLWRRGGSNAQVLSVEVSFLGARGRPCAVRTPYWISGLLGVGRVFLNWVAS